MKDEEEQHVHLYDLINGPRFFVLPAGFLLQPVQPWAWELEASSKLKLDSNLFRTLFHNAAPIVGKEYLICPCKVSLEKLKLINICCSLELKKMLESVYSEVVVEGDLPERQAEQMSSLQAKQVIFAKENPGIFEFPEAHLLGVIMADFIVRFLKHDKLDGAYLCNDEIKLSKPMPLEDLPICIGTQAPTYNPIRSFPCEPLVTDIGVALQQFLLPTDKIIYSSRLWVTEEHKNGSGVVVFTNRRDFTSLLPSIQLDEKDVVAFKVTLSQGIQLLDLRSAGTREIVSTFLALHDQPPVPTDGLWSTSDIFHMALFLVNVLPFCALPERDRIFPSGWIVDSDVSPLLEFIYLLDGDAAGEQVSSLISANSVDSQEIKSQEKYAKLYTQNGSAGLDLVHIE